MSVRLAVFDCDGTLVDGQAAVCEAMEAAFAAAGLSAPARGQIRRIVGLSLPVAIRHLAPEQEDRHGELVDGYRQAFFALREQGRVDEPLFDGIRDLVGALHAAGWKLGVATGKSRRGLDRQLQTLSLAPRFHASRCADEGFPKPHPEMLHKLMDELGTSPERTLMIGDTTHDLQMADNAGVGAIALACGAHAVADLRSLAPLACLADFAELMQWLGQNG